MSSYVFPNKSDDNARIKLEQFIALQSGKEPNSNLSHNQCVIDLRAVSEPTHPKTFTLFINLDRSGSMMLRVKDRTILEHAQHTLENIIHHFASPENYPNTKFNIIINHFDNENLLVMIDGNVVISLDETTAPKLVAEIKTIKPRGTTDIGAACAKACEILTQKDIGPCAHILLTDGNPTAGIKTSKGISKIVPQHCDNVFIGFGGDHDDVLLTEIASTVGGEYAFVDNIENAGIVYGEYLDNILSRVATNIAVTTENCEIFFENKWQHTYKVPSMSSEMKKILYLRHAWDTSDPIKLTLSYENFSYEGIDESEVLATHEIIINEYEKTKDVEASERNTEVIKKFWAVTVMGILDRIVTPKKQICYDIHNLSVDSDEDTEDPEMSIHGIEHVASEEIKNCLDDLKQYMSNHDLEDDLFLVGLCDDLIIGYELLDKRKGKILIRARLNGLRHQLSYQPSNVQLFREIERDDYNGLSGRSMLSTSSVSSSGLSFRCSRKNYKDDDFLPKPLPVLTHQISGRNTSAFTTPSQSKIQRSISIGTQDTMSDMA